MREAIGGGIKKLGEEIEKSDDSIKKLGDIRERITVRDDGPNPIASACDKKIEAMKRERKDFDNKRRLFKLALLELERYEWQWEAPPPMDPYAQVDISDAMKQVQDDLVRRFSDPGLFGGRGGPFGR